MSDLHIALSGLEVAGRALEIIGTNVANAATEGYHQQDVKITPQAISVTDGIAIGGARIAEVRRLMDVLLESQLLRQRPKLGQAAQELLTLRSLEGSLGDLGSEGLVSTITGFFGALRELAAQPDSQALQEQAVRAGDTLAKRFQHLGEFLQELQQQIRLEAQQLVTQVNHLASEIAALNHEISGVLNRGGNANLLLDQRDQTIAELAELADVRVQNVPGEPGVVYVVAWGTPLVMRSSTTELEVAVTEGGQLGVSVKDAGLYATDLSGGQLGGLLSLSNSILADVQTRLDTLAAEIIHHVNAHHVQGVGAAGAFTEITGYPVSGAQLADWDAWGTYLNEGTLHVRVTDRLAGTTVQHAVSVADDDTVQTIAAKLHALDGLTAGVVGSALRIAVEDTARYRFDFLPAASATCQVGWSGTAQPAVTGIYQGSENCLLTCTVVTGGAVGLTDGLSVEVRNDAGELVTTLNVGLGYAAGDRLAVTDGVYATFGTGTLAAGEQFTIRALANADNSGFLAAAGVNTFFKGSTVRDIAVDDTVLARPGRLAFALGEDMNDNVNVRRMAEIDEQPLAALGNVSASDACRMIVTRVGERIRFAQSRQEGLEGIMQQLLNQRDGISGVDVNEQAGKMLMFERMYEALAKLIATQQLAFQSLLDIV